MKEKKPKIASIIGRNLKMKLNEHNLSQKDLANILGVDNSTVGKWLSASAIPRLEMIQSMADYFCVPKSYFLDLDNSEDNSNDNSKDNSKVNIETNKFKFFDVGVSAGLLEEIEPKTKPDSFLQISKKIMGKYANNKSIIILRVNGDSMNNVIPKGSFIFIDTSIKDISRIKDRDIVVFSKNGEYNVKRFFNDKKNQRLLFKPDSNNELFTTIEIKYESATNLSIIGKVVKYIVNLK